MYALYAPVQATYKGSQSLKGLAKMRYDKEHKESLAKYPELKERMQSFLQNGEKDNAETVERRDTVLTSRV